MTDLALMIRDLNVFPVQDEFQPARGFGGLLPEAARAPDIPMKVEIILVFASTTEVLNVEDRLESLDLDFELVPVPKEVNPNCGLAVSFQEEARPVIMAALHQAGFQPVSAYERRGDDFRPRASGGLLDGAVAAGPAIGNG